MPIKVKKNTHYGSTLVNQKYAPLVDPGIEAGNRSIHSGLLLNRMQMLRDARVLPQTLFLVTNSWDDVTDAEGVEGIKPPLVVVSSNRSLWIRQGIEAGNQQLNFLGLENFENAADLNALTATKGQTISPPLYSPKRIGDEGPRNVYIVVHAHEYQTYKGNLEGTGITVVGWMFRMPRGVDYQLTGFGASRFAAIEFCKTLRNRVIETRAHAPWDYAWLFDDNVVGLTTFPGYTAVENTMTPEHVCAGLRGGTKAESFITIRKWAREQVNAGHELPPLTSVTPNLVQQGALWNIDYLTRNHLNFGVNFLQSGEDTSISKYFDWKGINYHYYESIGVRKEVTTFDNGNGSKALKEARARVIRLFVDRESANPDPPEGEPPPPIMVQSLDNGDNNIVVTLGEFVVNYVLPNALDTIREKAGEDETRYNARCQAVEQISWRAIEGKQVTDEALDATFKLNGDHDQVVTRMDK